MGWLRRFFYSDDPIVRLVGGMLEPEAEMWREALMNEGVRAFTKVMDAVAISDGRATGTNCALFVNRSDLERAREVLGPALEGELADEDHLGQGR